MNESKKNFDFELRRALLEGAAGESSHADSRRAFRRFVRRNGLGHNGLGHNGLGHSRRARLYAIISVAAAACVAAVVMLTLRSGSEGEPTGELAELGQVVYAAHDQVQYVTLNIDGKSLNCTGNAFTQNGISVKSDHEIEVFRMTDDTDIDPEDVSISVPAGRTAKVTLCDGTVIHLNAGSSLSFPNHFEATGERNVRLHGEGLFEVAHDAARPFSVDCGSCRTEVLGTRFNVRAYDNEDAVVTLLEGSVRVSLDSLPAINDRSAHSDAWQNKNPGNVDGYSVVLTPGKSVSVAPVASSDGDKTMTVADADADVVTAWTDGLFYYHGQTLREILTEIGRWYNVNVVFATNRHLNDRLHLNTERSLPIVEVIRQIQMISEVTVTAKGNALVVN